MSKLIRLVLITSLALAAASVARAQFNNTCGFSGFCTPNGSGGTPRVPCTALELAFNDSCNTVAYPGIIL